MPGNSTFEVAKLFAAAVRAAGVTRKSRIATTLSGGPDSTALALLCAWWTGTAAAPANVEAVFQQHNKSEPAETALEVPLVRHAWLCSHGRPLMDTDTKRGKRTSPMYSATYAFIVDHGLRESSASEARQSCTVAEQLGLVPDLATLEWAGGPPPSGELMAEARKKRYSAWAGACRRLGVDVLLTGHHADDQVETFLIRMTRCSGVDGLAAMPLIQTLAGGPRGIEPVRLVRPLLSCTKAQLEGLCRENAMHYITDPTNADCRFIRSVFRQLLASQGEAHPLKEGHTAVAHPLMEGHTAEAYPLKEGHTATTYPLKEGHTAEAYPLKEGHTAAAHSLKEGHTPVAYTQSSGTQHRVPLLERAVSVSDVPCVVLCGPPPERGTATETSQDAHSAQNGHFGGLDSYARDDVGPTMGAVGRGHDLLLPSADIGWGNYVASEEVFGTTDGLGHPCVPGTCDRRGLSLPTKGEDAAANLSEDVSYTVLHKDTRSGPPLCGETLTRGALCEGTVTGSPSNAETLRDDVLRLVRACREARTLINGRAARLLSSAIIPYAEAVDAGFPVPAGAGGHVAGRGGEDKGGEDVISCAAGGDDGFEGGEGPGGEDVIVCATGVDDGSESSDRQEAERSVCVFLDVRAFSGAGAEEGMRAMEAIVQVVGGRGPLRSSTRHRLWERVEGGRLRQAYTCGGCILRPIPKSRGQTALVARQAYPDKVEIVTVNE